MGAHAFVCNTGVMAEVGWEELRVEVQGRPVFVRRGPEVPGSIPHVHVHGFAVSGSYLLPTAGTLAATSPRSRRVRETWVRRPEV